MIRFRAEFYMREADCSFCPFFMRQGNELATCMLAEHRDEPSLMVSIEVPGRAGSVVQAFPMPIDCPLDAVTDNVM